MRGDIRAGCDRRHSLDRVPAGVTCLASSDGRMDGLGSGQPLTVSAEGKSYTLPAVDAPDWKKQFTDRC